MYVVATFDIAVFRIHCHGPIRSVLHGAHKIIYDRDRDISCAQHTTDNINNDNDLDNNNSNKNNNNNYSVNSWQLES